MRRRDFLASTAAAATAVAGGPGAPALAQSDRSRVVRFVPQANLTSLDPIWTTAAVTENHGWAIFETLFGMTDDMKALRKAVTDEEKTSQARAAALQQASSAWSADLKTLQGLLD